MLGMFGLKSGVRKDRSKDKKDLNNVADIADITDIDGFGVVGFPERLGAEALFSPLYQPEDVYSSTGTPTVTRAADRKNKEFDFATPCTENEIESERWSKLVLSGDHEVQEQSNASLVVEGSCGEEEKWREMVRSSRAEQNALSMHDL